MKRSGRVALVAAAGFLLAPAHPIRAETASVTIVDQLSEGQQEETIAVYFAGVLAGTLHVDAGHPIDQFTATFERASHIHYTLCGRLLRQELDGSISAHPIDNGGVLGDVAGRTLFANTIGDKLFSLEGSEGAATGEVQAGPACAAATS